MWIGPKWLRLITHAAALTPLATLLWDGFQNQLTVNPIQEITLRTGKAALVILVLSLAATPLNAIFGLRQVVPLRRPLGLYAFFYASLHFLTFVALDYGLDWELIQQAIVEKRFVIAGFGAFLLMVPLALTSTTGWQRRLGKRWKHLHRAVYVSAALAVLHFLWLVKAEAQRVEPLLYGAAVGMLLLLRVPVVRRTLRRAFGPRPAVRAAVATSRAEQP